VTHSTLGSKATASGTETQQRRRTVSIWLIAAYFCSHALFQFMGLIYHLVRFGATDTSALRIPVGPVYYVLPICFVPFEFATGLAFFNLRRNAMMLSAICFGMVLAQYVYILLMVFPLADSGAYPRVDRSIFYAQTHIFFAMGAVYYGAVAVFAGRLGRRRVLL
jgi:hypothetical protein